MHFLPLNYVAFDGNPSKGQESDHTSIKQSWGRNRETVRGRNAFLKIIFIPREEEREGCGSERPFIA